MLEVNEYFDGKVKSIAVQGGDLPATVGVMAAGEYTFATSQREYMTVVEGSLRVRLPGSDQWRDFTSGETFIVEAGESFDLIVERESAYLCKYE
ncbi:MAG: pyrimidine/purine nucleoside phosphorylase [Halioglobus sp.]